MSVDWKKNNNSVLFFITKHCFLICKIWKNKIFTYKFLIYLYWDYSVFWYLETVTPTAPDLEVTLGEGGGERKGKGCFYFFGGLGLGVYMLPSVFHIFSAAEQMVTAILIARASLSGTTGKRLSCDL